MTEVEKNICIINYDSEDNIRSEMNIDHNGYGSVYVYDEKGDFNYSMLIDEEFISESWHDSKSGSVLNRNSDGSVGVVDKGGNIVFSIPSEQVNNILDEIEGLGNRLDEELEKPFFVQQDDPEFWEEEFDGDNNEYDILSDEDISDILRSLSLYWRLWQNSSN